jgi:hypothetical protein
MSNHSDMPGDSPIPESIRRALKEPLIGATGTHPQGKLTPHDEGAIQFALGVKDGKVVIDFGTPCVWLGMEPTQALELASALIKHAKDAARGTGSILTLNL